MTHIYFRVDATTKQGEGHLRRCLTLAETLTSNFTITFCYSYLSPAAKKLLDKSYYNLLKLTSDLIQQQEYLITSINKHKQQSVLIIDHYLLDHEWERPIKLATACNIVIIDDLANRKHYCDLLIDSNYFRKKRHYQMLVNNECQLFCGVNYLLFSEQVLQNKHLLDKNITKKNKQQTHIFFGATDPHINSAKIAILLSESFSQKVVLSITQSTANRAQQIKTLANKNSITISKKEEHFSQCMAESEFAIGAPGMTLWERLILGCKTGCFATSENQINILQKLDRDNICCYLGPIWKMSYTEIHDALANFYSSGALKLELAEINKYFSGNGCQLISEKITNFCPHLKTMNTANIALVPYTKNHIKKTVYWLSSNQLRTTFGFSKQITIESHTKWLRQQTSFYLWAIFVDENHVGNISMRVNSQQKSAYLEIYIGEENAQGRGVGKATMNLINHWALVTMELERIELITLAGNIAAERLYKSNGFVLASLNEKDQGQKINGHFIKHNKWQLSKENYFNNVNQLQKK